MLKEQIFHVKYMENLDSEFNDKSFKKWRPLGFSSEIATLSDRVKVEENSVIKHCFCYSTAPLCYMFSQSSCKYI